MLSSIMFYLRRHTSLETSARTFGYLWNRVPVPSAIRDLRILNATRKTHMSLSLPTIVAVVQCEGEGDGDNMGNPLGLVVVSA